MSTDENVPALTPNQILVLVVLMAEARMLNNNELKELAGFSLTGQDNKKLEQNLRLIDTDRSHRPYSHQLTEKGWHVARRLHTAEPPRQGGSASRSLLTLLRNLSRSLDRLQISHGEFFKQTSPPVAPTTEARIRAAYRDLAAEPGGWIGLADLRDHLADLDRPTLDAALLAMRHQSDVRIIPVANSKALAPRDRAAALRIGERDNHSLSIGVP